MPTIDLTTIIKADIHICFDLASSIDLHSISTARTKEKAVAGVTTGLIRLNETVTWEATHFGIRQQLTSLITAFDRPFHFRDEQQKGAFKFIKHDHYFEQRGSETHMRDVFRFQSPYGYPGRLFDRLVLTRYLTKFLRERNQVIKEYAESEGWKALLRSET